MKKYTYIFNYDHKRPIVREFMAENDQQADEIAEKHMASNIDCYMRKDIYEQR